MYGIRKPCTSCGSGVQNFNFTSTNWNYNKINTFLPSTLFYNSKNNHKYISPVRKIKDDDSNEYISFSPRPVTSKSRFIIEHNGDNYPKCNKFQIKQTSFSPYKISNNYNNIPMKQNNNYFNFPTSNNNYSNFDNIQNKKYRNLSVGSNPLQTSYLNTNFSTNLNNNFDLSSSNNIYNNNNTIYYPNRLNNPQQYISTGFGINFSNNSNINLNNYNYLQGINSPREITFDYNNFANGINQLVNERKTFFLLMYGAFDNNGMSWCSDCTFAEPLIQNAKRIVFSKQSEKKILWVNVPIEKEKKVTYKFNNYLRMVYVPTLIYFKNGIEIRRIVQEQMFTQESINNFILEAYE